MHSLRSLLNFFKPLPMKRAIMFWPLLLLLVTPCAVAVPHTVSVQAVNKEAGPVVDALKARLNGTERYQVVSDSAAELIIHIVCDDMEQYKINGAVCSYSFSYAHPHISILLVPIGEGMGLLSSKDRSRIGEMVFQSFVEATTEQKILDARANVEFSIALFCVKSENAKTCGR